MSTDDLLRRAHAALADAQPRLQGPYHLAECQYHSDIDSRVVPVCTCGGDEMIGVRHALLQEIEAALRLAAPPSRAAGGAEGRG